MNYTDFLPQITESLKQIDPYRIYLFGSTVTGNAGEDSDIDIAVVLDSEYRHKTYDEKLETKVRVRESIRDISFKVPIDLLVYSKPEFRMLQEINPGFAREITEKGRLLYEKSYP